MFSTPQRSEVPLTQAARFGTTQWSLVLKAGKGAEEALMKLCQIYWQPLYGYIRRRGHAFHEAQDLTQAFFNTRKAPPRSKTSIRLAGSSIARRPASRKSPPLIPTFPSP